MRGNRDLVSALAARQRARSWLRAATALIGLGGLATAGVIAWNLPAPVHTTAHTPATPAQAQPSAPATVIRSRGEDDDGRGRTVTSGSSPSARTPSHATSGGSAAS